MVDMKIRKALVLGSFWFCASFCIGAPVANTFLPVVPVPAEYSVGEGYFYFNADMKFGVENESQLRMVCLLYTSPSPRDTERSRMPSSA